MRITRTPLALVAVLALMMALAGSAAAKPSSKPFEIEPGSFHIVPSTVQAGAHEDLTTSFEFAHNAAGESNNDARTVIVNLPPGVIGNNTAVPTCSQSQLLGGQVTETKCPPASQVGTFTLRLDLNTEESFRTRVPLYNMEATPGTAAEFAFKTGVSTVFLQVTVRPGDSGLTVTSSNILTIAEPREISVTYWGDPAATSHDIQRGVECGHAGTPRESCEYQRHKVESPVQTAGIPVKPFLSMPTSCSGQPLVVSIEANSWEHPEEWSKAQTDIGPIVECERVPFNPSIAVQPTTRFAESSSGLNISLLVPQTWEKPETLKTSNLKDTTVALPVGYTANPSLASGLGVCTVAQLESETSSSLPGSGCPAESKIGTVEVETPVLDEKLTGNIYIAKPFENKFDSLLGLYIVVKDPVRGIIVKLEGHIEPNPVTGQLVTTFDENPQVPFSRFTLKLRQGENSPLVSPPACGAYTAQADFTPWSDPLVPQVLTNVFAIEDGIGGGACPAGGIPPFKPGIVAGTLNNSAGSYSPMDIHITRNDGEQEITRFTSILPAGLTAKLTGVPFCPDADIEAAKHVTGAQEEAEPSCPRASEIGHSLVGAGVGSVLAYTPGRYIWPVHTTARRSLSSRSRARRSARSTSGRS